MPKIDPLHYSRPKPSVKSGVFIDPRYPDAKVEVTFRSPDVVDYNTIQDVTTTFTQYYSDKPYPSIDGKHMMLGPSLIGTCAAMFVLQEVVEDDDRYSMEELVALSVTMPTVFTEISQFIAELTRDCELGKLVGVQLSLEPSPDSQNDTPSSMSE